MKAFLSLAIACICFVAMPAASASALVIDHFDSGVGYSMAVNAGSPAASATAAERVAALAIGGDRQVDLTFVSTGITGLGASVDHPTVTASLHVLAYSDDATVMSVLKLTYAGPAGTGFTPTDITSGGTATSLNILYLSSDLGSTTICTVTDSLNNVGTLSQLSPSGASVGSFLFTGFSGAVDFTKVVKIQYEIDSVANGDYVIDALETGGQVPEPMTMAGLAMGLGSLSYYIRKRRAA